MSNLSFPKDLRDRILFTIAVLVIYRVGVQVPTPGVDNEAVLSFFRAQGGGVFGLLNTFTGGALEQFSVFALGIIPYITASIIFQLLQSGVPYLEQLKKEGESGRTKINQYTRYATVLLSIFQGFGISRFLMASTSPEGLPLVVTPYFGPVPFIVFTIITLTAGSCLIMWLGERITEKGVGNGASLIIFAGIAAGIPSGAVNLFQMIRSGEMSGGLGLGLVLFMILVVGVIIFVEAGQRRIPVQYSQRAMGKQPSTQSSHLPLKLNLSGVIPPIFASSLLLFPTTLAQYVDAEWLQNAGSFLAPDSSIFNLFFVAMIVFFCFFYTEVVFNPTEMADNLKKYGGFIPGIRAGRHTADYVKRVVDLLTVGGATYLSLVCILPTFLIQQLNTPFYFGGTSLLILVGVALDTTQQIQSHLLSAKYEGLVRGVRVRSRRVQY
ncbi:MAG: preprotein translocase subunit SecY [Bdellovibrionales bacterium]|nr:preprotein translocase subunit SecY [Bdellovibrionales bacterium]